jgi:pSer/pThr/pTyr-binding forkhead associated (FHA) protein
MATPLTIQVYRGSELLRTETFTREIIKIGRLATAHLSLEDDRISRVHAVIEVSPEGAVSIIDMGGVEGTYVNGKKVTRGRLESGDTVTMGGLRLVLEVGGAKKAAPVLAPAPSGRRAEAGPGPIPTPTKVELHPPGRAEVRGPCRDLDLDLDQG